jgi:hypothetical protein
MRLRTKPLTAQRVKASPHQRSWIASEALVWKVDPFTSLLLDWQQKDIRRSAKT